MLNRLSRTISLATKGLAMSSSRMIVRLSENASVFATLDSHVGAASIVFGVYQHHAHFSRIYRFIIQGPSKNMLLFQRLVLSSSQMDSWKEELTQLFMPVHFALVQLLLPR